MFNQLGNAVTYFLGPLLVPDDNIPGPNGTTFVSAVANDNSSVPTPLDVRHDIQISRSLPVGIGPVPCVGIDQGATVIGCKQPFVGVHDHAVRAFNPIKDGPGPRVCQSGQAVSTVDVEPEALLGTEIRQSVEIVDGAGVDGARIAHHAERDHAFAVP